MAVFNPVIEWNRTELDQLNYVCTRQGAGLTGNVMRKNDERFTFLQRHHLSEPPPLCFHEDNLGSIKLTKSGNAVLSLAS